MVDKKLFSSSGGPKMPTVKNKAGAKAYDRGDKAALAQYACTGFFGDTYYASGAGQLAAVKELITKVDDEFLAKVAIYARKEAHMKDMPAYALAALSVSNPQLARKIFPVVIDNVKELRTFCQILRSGQAGRTSFGYAMKEEIKKFLEKDPNWLFRNSVGQSPSLGDIIKMTHPKPATEYHDSLFAYLLGREKEGRLPRLVAEYEAFKKNPNKGEVPNLPFQMISSIDMSTETWKEIFRNGGWHFVRMNLNTAKRHGVLDDPEMVKLIAAKLTDEDMIRKSRVFPYQLLMAYLNVQDMPKAIIEALHVALELACNNIPKIEGKVIVAPDISYSMTSRVTGAYTSRATYAHVAALIAAAIMRTCDDVTVLPFHGRVVRLKLDPFDTVMTNASKIAGACTNGTDLSKPFEYLRKKKAHVDAMIVVSDNMSWMDNNRYARHTGARTEWNKLRGINPKAKCVCIDIEPGRSTQMNEAKDVLNVGGFSDAVFDVMAGFFSGEGGTWVETIEAIALPD